MPRYSERFEFNDDNVSFNLSEEITDRSCSVPRKSVENKKLSLYSCIKLLPAVVICALKLFQLTIGIEMF